MKNTNTKDTAFINEHILNRISFEDIYKQEIIQNRAKKAFYAVWTNWVFINPKTENLQELKESDFFLIKKLSYGTKNRLQSYLAFHINKDHYDMDFESLTEEESYSIIQMCEEIFNDSYILVNWWRSEIQRNDELEERQTGEEWFKKSKEKFQNQKLINKLGFCFIDLMKKRFLILKEDQLFWTQDQTMATRFILSEKGIMLDQEKESVKEEAEKMIEMKTKMSGLKMFLQQRNQNANEINIERGVS